MHLDFFWFLGLKVCFGVLTSPVRIGTPDPKIRVFALKLSFSFLFGQWLVTPT